MIAPPLLVLFLFYVFIKNIFCKVQRRKPNCQESLEWWRSHVSMAIQLFIRMWGYLSQVWQSLACSSSIDYVWLLACVTLTVEMVKIIHTLTWLSKNLGHGIWILDAKANPWILSYRCYIFWWSAEVKHRRFNLPKFGFQHRVPHHEVSFNP